MKNKIKKYAINLIVLTILGAGSASAQRFIEFPCPDYLMWDFPCDTHLGNPACMIPLHDSIFVAFPFFHKQSDANKSCTVYGVAIPFHFCATYGNPAGVPVEMWETLNFELSLYKATIGDSILRLLRSETFRVDSGQAPDVIANHLEGLFEFYFSEPVQVTGTFLVGISDGSLSTHRQYWQDTVLIKHFFTSDYISAFDTNCWFYGYEGLINKKSQKFCGYRRHSGSVPIQQIYSTTPSRISGGYPVPDVEALNLRQFGHSTFIPIIHPRHTGIELVERGAESVRLTPNPAEERVAVQSEVGIRSVEVTDMAGRRVAGKRCNGQELRTELDVRPLPSGIYIVKVETVQGMSTLTLVKE